MNDDILREFLEHGTDERALPQGAARVREMLGSPAVWEDPPPGTLDGVLGQIAAERQAARPMDARPMDASPPDADFRAPRHRAGRRRLLVAVAAAIVFGVGGAAGWFAGQELPNQQGEQVNLAGTELAPRASGTARVRETVSGVAISLNVTGLPPAAPGTFYEAWLKSPEDDLVAIGTFHMREGAETVELWAGIDLADYPLMTVTLQREGQGPESSGQVVLSGPIPVPE